MEQKITDAAIERFARAMCKAQGINPEKLDPPSEDAWGGTSAPRMKAWEYWRVHARAFLAGQLEMQKWPVQEDEKVAL